VGGGEFILAHPDTLGEWDLTAKAAHRRRAPVSEIGTKTEEGRPPPPETGRAGARAEGRRALGGTRESVHPSHGTQMTGNSY
jgi:hypothetical protein